MDKLIIMRLLELIDSLDNNERLKEIDLATEVHARGEVSMYKLCTRGSRDKGTPFYFASMVTHIVREDWCEGKLVYAQMIYSLPTEFDQQM